MTNEQFLELLATHQPMNLEQWIQFLKLNKEEQIAFEQMVTQSINDFEIGLSKKKKLLLASDLNIVKGRLAVVSEHFGFVDHENFSVYISANNFKGAMNKDEVAIRYYSTNDSRYEGEVLKVIKRSTTYVIGTMEMKRKKLFFISYDKKINQFVEYDNPHNFNLQEGQRVIGTIKKYGNPLRVDVTSIIGQVKDPGVDVLTILHQFDITMPFSDATLQQVSSIPQTINKKDFPTRRDLTQDIIFTIDGDDTKDIDDAISIKKTDTGYQLGVHIADVSHYVTKNSALDDDAQERSTSVYVVDRVVPMLPKELSNGICSLNPNVLRLAMSVHLNVDEYGHLVDYEFFESIIESKQQLTYRQVNQFLEDPKQSFGIDPSIQPRLLEMHILSDLLRTMREALGATEFETSESSFVVDDEGNVLDVYEHERGIGEFMIEDFMVLANHAAANYFDTHQYPTLYRVHEKPNVKKMQALSATLRVMGYRMKGSLENIHPEDIQRALYHFKDKPSYPLVSKMILRSMMKAKYHPENLGHFGLGLKQYLHFTSPIRRYPDLEVHRQMKKFNFEQTINPQIIEQDEKRLIDLALWTSDRERNAVEAEREVEKMKKAQYMKQFIGESFEGLISGVTGFGLFVQLDNTCEGLVHIKTMKDYYVFDEQKMMLLGREHGRTYHLGSRVEIKVIDVDLVDYEVHFELKEPKKSSEKRHPRRPRNRRV